MLFSKLAVIGFCASVFLQLTFLYNKSEQFAVKYHFPGIYEWTSGGKLGSRVFNNIVSHFVELNGRLVNIMTTLSLPIKHIFQNVIPWDELCKIMVIIENCLATALYGLTLWIRDNPRVITFCAATLIIATVDSNLRKTLNALLVEKAEVNQRLNRINTLVRTVTVVEQWNRALKDLELKTQMVRECVEYWKQIRETIINQNNATALHFLLDSLKNSSIENEAGDFDVRVIADIKEAELLDPSRI